MFEMFRRFATKDQPRPRAPRLNWLQAEERHGVLQFGEVRVHVCLPDAIDEKPSSDKDFIVVKIPSMVEKAAALVEEIHPKNVIELGIFKGGSVVLYNEMCRPRKFVAVDINTERLPHLEAYLGRHPDGANVSLQFGVDQADRPRLAKIYDSVFGGAPLDLVIDDASHFLF